MKRIIVAPGAFKHSLTAAQAASAIESGLARSGLDAEVIVAPIADGGNGTLDAFLSAGGQRRTVRVDDPLGRPIEADYGLLADGETAVIEMALASGLELLEQHELDPLQTSTYGTGQLMRAALADGVQRVIVGMGGSATVDGGAGCLQALGVGLMDAYGQDIPRGGGHLDQLFIIDPQGLNPRWREVEVLIASDVDNPTLGPQGAAAIFGPQKGASAAQVQTLESNLSHFFTTIYRQLKVDMRDIPGGGAAGAFSAGLMAFLNARIEPGIELILKHSGFESWLAEADLVITGEGQIDNQTIHGKGPVGVARLARAHGVPTVAIVGSLNADEATLHEAGIAAVLPVVNRPMHLDEALQNASELVEQAARRLGYLLQLG